MLTDSEYSFFCKLMDNLHIHVHRFPPDQPPLIDLGTDELTGYENRSREMFREMQDNVLYLVCDVFAFCYCYLRLPETGEVLLIGPYLRRTVSEQEIMMILEHGGLSPRMFAPIKLAYDNLPQIASEDLLITLLTTLGERIWGSAGSFELQRVHAEKLLLSGDILEDRLPQVITEAASFKLMENRYEAEKRLMHLISQGRTHRAQMIIEQISDRALETRAADPLRNMKNYGIVLNTLLRKAVEQGGVHPFHIDQLSSQMAKKLEQTRTLEQCRALFSSMVHKYCLLVKNHSMQNYSLLVQHVILRIEADLTADLSLKAHAEALNVNASYLSTLFKKETGSTLTDYVTRKRIDNAIFLLNATDMQVQTIAQYCGIPDVNYFTKTFKRLIGKTPKEYRTQTRPEG